MCQETECSCGQHGHGEQHGMGQAHGNWSGHHGYRGGGCDCGCDCGCEGHHGSSLGPGFVQRRFISKEEIITRMEAYLKQLKAESAGVEERIVELKKTG
jgi:hypothetical protein